MVTVNTIQSYVMYNLRWFFEFLQSNILYCNYHSFFTYYYLILSSKLMWMKTVKCGWILFIHYFILLSLLSFFLLYLCGWKWEQMKRMDAYSSLLSIFCALRFLFFLFFLFFLLFLFFFFFSLFFLFFLTGDVLRPSPTEASSSSPS